jgi:hypothetical protein
MTPVTVRCIGGGWWAVYRENPATAVHFRSWRDAIAWANRIARGGRS